MSSTKGWIRVSRDRLCPICEKPDNCEVSADGQMVWCGRVSEDSIDENGGGQYLHRLSGSYFKSPHDGRRSSNLKALPKPPASGPEDEETKRLSAKTRVQIENRARASFVGGSENRTLLAEVLGVSVESLTRLRVGWNRNDGVWDFPERDAAGEIIGINRRYRDGRKIRVAGGKSGLTYARDWDTETGPIFLVEGGSDTAALMTAGLCVVGRPSNRGGAELLISLLETAALDRPIIVIAERDEKPNGQWPGRDGAIKICEKLVQGLGRSVQWALPPDDCKDARDWLKLAIAAGITHDRLRPLFLEGLQVETIFPPPVYPYVECNALTVSVEVWREKMLQARIASLGRPGVYLDCSSTGAGKSSVDLSLVLHATQQGAA